MIEFRNFVPFEHAADAGQSLERAQALLPPDQNEFDHDEYREAAAELKKACGTGGTVADGAVEIQGDQRERLRPLLAAKGWTVRG